jgi:hypothetical protein
MLSWDTYNIRTDAIFYCSYNQLFKYVFSFAATLLGKSYKSAKFGHPILTWVTLFVAHSTLDSTAQVAEEQLYCRG